MNNNPKYTSKNSAQLLTALAIVVEEGKASTSLLQRRMTIGYKRAIVLIAAMESRGWISQSEGSKPRNVCISAQEYEELIKGLKFKPTEKTEV